MVRVYVASNLPTEYPYKLQKPSTLNRSVRETAESFILDSGIGDDVSNREVIELACEYDADYVVAKDYLHDQDRTTESVREFLDILPEYDCDATPFIPLQPPYDEHVQDLPGHSHYMLGGMVVNTVSTGDRIRWVREFRAEEPDAYAHALGVGGGIRFTRAVAKDGLVDSIDCATPEMAASNGCVLDDELRQRELRVWKGDGARKRNVPLAEFNSWQISDVWDREQTACEQLTAADF